VLSWSEAGGSHPLAGVETEPASAAGRNYRHFRQCRVALAKGQVGLPTARFETVDGAFDQLSMPENIGKLALILLAKIIQDLPLAAGKSGGSRGAILAFAFYVLLA